ncbi:MAG: ABC transporter permease [Gemmatimonadaceae bacterium]
MRPPVATISLIALLATVITVLVVAGVGGSHALSALWTGSVGSWNALSSATLVRATPLILAGLAVALAFRAGVWNIGAEGQLLVGAAAGTAVALSLAPSFGNFMSIVGALLAGTVAGSLWAGIATVLRKRFGVLEVISTIVLNFIALFLVGYLVHGPLREASGVYPQSETLPDAAHLPRLFDGTRLHWGFVLALVAAPVLWWILRSTAAGFRVRASGLNADAARVAGRIDVARTTALAFLASGALAGLAGAIEVTGVTFALYEGISPGYGYTAIAVALIARLNPLAVIASGIFFGALESGALAMQREANVPSVIVYVLEAGLILVALLTLRSRTREE